jgi:hypothetical protein
MDENFVHVHILNCNERNWAQIMVQTKILKQNSNPMNRPILISIIACLLGAFAVAIIIGGIYINQNHSIDIPTYQIMLATLTTCALFMAIAWGIWTLKDWARTTIMLILMLAGLFYGIMIVFQGFNVIFSGEHIIQLKDIFLDVREHYRHRYHSNNNIGRFIEISNVFYYFTERKGIRRYIGTLSLTYLCSECDNHCISNYFIYL